MHREGDTIHPTPRWEESEIRTRDRYQEALRELIEAKMRGLPIKPQALQTPAPVVDLMAALKRSLAQEMPAPKPPFPRNAASRQHLIGDNGHCFCPYRVAAKKKEEPATGPATLAPKERRKV
jgi:hypothetical protein